MADQIPVLIILAPLFGGILVLLLGLRYRSVCFPIAVASLGVSLFSALHTFRTVLLEGPQRYFLSGWERGGGFAVGIEYRIDQINGLVLIMIAFVALLSVIHSRSRVSVETPAKVPQVYILSLLLVSGLLGMTITNDAFNLYVLLEISSLSSYALIAIGSRRAALSAFNYVIMGTIGASFLLLGVGYLFIQTGTLNMQDIHGALMAEGLINAPSIKVALMLILIGLWIKMGLFPLHGWLPNAYSYAPSATGTLMGPLVTKVMIYIMIRMMVSVFGIDFLYEQLAWTKPVSLLASIAIIGGSFLAVSQTDLRKMLCYLIVAEVGYMVGGAWVGNLNGMTGAIYHILGDALMTLCLFFVVGIVVAKTGEHRLSAFKGLFKSMPLTMVCFVVVALAMIGLPPTCGFFSKWYLVRGGLEAGQYPFVIALLISSLVNAVIFFRLIEFAYFQSPDSDTAEAHGAHGESGAHGDEGEHSATAHAHAPVPMKVYRVDPDLDADSIVTEVPWGMKAPLLIVAACLLLLGIFNSTVTAWIADGLKGVGF